MSSFIQQNLMRPTPSAADQEKMRMFPNYSIVSYFAA